MGLESAISRGRSAAQSILQEGLDAASTLGRVAVGVPLPSRVIPIIIPLATDDPGWLATDLNQYAPMSFFLNIARNLNPITYGAYAATLLAAGGDAAPLIGGGTGGIQSARAGGGRNIQELQDSGSTSFLPTGSAISDVTGLAARQAFIPPLTLLLNPYDINFRYSKNFNTYFTKAGVNTEYIGNQLTVLTATGNSPGFYTKERGLTRLFRTQSIGFQNLMSLYFVYRNNGYDFLKYSPSINIVGAVTIFYDGVFYVGNFTNFNLGEDSTSPFKMRYTFTFTIRHRLRSYLSDRFTSIPFPLLNNITGTLGTT